MDKPSQSAHAWTWDAFPRLPSGATMGPMGLASPAEAGSQPRALRGRALAEWRRARSVELAGEGFSYEYIACAVGFANRGTAWKAVQKALSHRTAEAVEELRTLEVDRLDALQVALWSRALDGDLPAVNAIVKIIRERVRLLGLDRHVQLERGPQDGRRSGIPCGPEPGPRGPGRLLEIHAPSVPSEQHTLPSWLPIVRAWDAARPRRTATAPPQNRNSAAQPPTDTTRRTTSGRWTASGAPTPAPTAPTPRLHQASRGAAMA